MRVKELFTFIRERHRIYERRKKGLPKPWTTDPILQQYRFCNVYRELDTVTQWIDKHWRKPHATNPDLWFWMCVARLVNWPDTLSELGLYPSGWGCGKNFIKVLHRRASEGKKVFSGAYIVGTNGRAMDKAEYLAEFVLTPMWNARKYVRPSTVDTLDSFHTRLLTFDGMGSFMAAQVVADIKYVDPLLKAEDWWEWAASGPGSRRGLNVVCEREMEAPWRENEWRTTLRELLVLVGPMLEKAGMPPLHAQDLQNCLCEYFKFTKVLRGLGRPRSLYPGA